MFPFPWQSSGSGPGSTTAVRERIEDSERFNRVVAELSVQLGLPVAQVRSEARDCLKEMVAAENASATDVWSRLGSWLSRAYEFDVDRANVARLKDLDSSKTLVFLPNHRSYLDPFVLRAVLEPAGFPPNFVLGGSNLSFFPVGPVGQRSGLVFIRRQFKDAPIYKAMLGVYLAYLVEQGANLEWYIEGGRTRTGKLRPPRMGILSYLLDAFDESDVEDLTFVPVSIIYDQQHEVGAIAAEESGGTKKPESVKWALRYARAQGVRRGKVHVRFAEPFALRPMLEELGARRGTGEVRLAVPKVAFEVSHRINGATPITAPAVLALVLLSNVDRALTEEQMRRGVIPLAEYMHARGLPLAGGMSTENLDILTERTPSEGTRALETLIEEGVVRRFDGGLAPVYSINPDRYLEAAFYRNTLSHFFVTRSIVELALMEAAEVGATDLEPVVWAEALRLRDLLKYEFFFPSKDEFSAQVQAEMEIMSPGWRDEVDAATPEVVSDRVRALPFRTSPRILGPFLEAYSVLADRLAAADPAARVDQAALISECLGVAQQMFLQRQLHSPESVSKDLFTNALLLAGNRGLLEPGQPDLAQKRSEFAAELADVVARVEEVRAIPGPLDDQQDRQEG